MLFQAKFEGVYRAATGKQWRGPAGGEARLADPARTGYRISGGRAQNENAGPWLKNDQEFRTATAERSTKCGDTCAAPTQPALNLTPNEFITVGTSGREMKGQGPLRVCDSEGTRERFEGVTFALDQIEGKR